MKKNKSIDKISDTIYSEWRDFIDGENDALSTTYTEFKLPLYLTAFYYLKDERKAEDIVNDIFLKLLEMSVSSRKEHLNGVHEKLGNFLNVMVKNKCLDKIKVDSNRRSLLNSMTSFITRSEDRQSNIEIDFSELIVMLPEQQRIIFELHLSGYDNQAIADELSISHNTVRNTLSTSKKKLRNLWNKFM